MYLELQELPRLPDRPGQVEREDPRPVLQFICLQFPGRYLVIQIIPVYSRARRLQEGFNA